MKKLTLITLSFFLLAGIGYADPIVDFADDPFEAVHGQSSQSVLVGDLELAFSTNVGTLSWNPGPDGGVDGIGIRDDEVSLTEILTIGFSSNVYLSRIYITDLFTEGDPEYQEIGQYRRSIGGSWSDWDAGEFMAPLENLPYDATNGEIEIPFVTPVLVDALQFRTVSPSQNDFSIRGLDISAAPVPEPATLLLFGTGLIGLAGLGRKRLIKK